MHVSMSHGSMQAQKRYIVLLDVARQHSQAKRNGNTGKRVEMI
jgi:hypothetical protein